MKKVLNSQLFAIAALALVVCVMFAFPALGSGFLFTAAILPAGLVGNLQGKAGNFVFAKWKSIKTVRAYQPQVRQNLTEALLEQRMRFSLIQHIASVAINFIKSGYRNFKTSMSEYNYFISQNIAAGVTGVYPNLVRAYSALKFSAGTLLGANNPSITTWTTAALTVQWTDNTGEANALDTDYAQILVVCEGSELTGIVKASAPAQRGNEECALSLPQHFATKTAHVYLTFYSADGQLVSDSQYVGSKVITLA